jgi:integrase
MHVITTELLRTLPREACDIADTKQRGLVIRCRPSGTHSYLVRAGRGKWITLGQVGKMTLSDARKEALRVLSQVALGETPRQQPKAKTTPTLKAYLVDTYGPWVRQHRKTGDETITRITAAFTSLQGLPLDQLTTFVIEKWRTERRRANLTPGTINRDVAALRGALTQAVRWKIIKTHPFGDLTQLKIDSLPRVRYLLPDEAMRLHNALVARDDTRRQERATANEWRQARGHIVYPPFGTYTDHLHPLVMLALHTGLRRGELFSLEWLDVNLDGRLLTVRGTGDENGTGTKSGHTRYVDLNATAVDVLTMWRIDRLAFLSQDALTSALVFPSASGTRMDNVQSAWEKVLKAAEITAFRFHDLRHTFASWLAIAGVDLNTIRELMGHADLKMTLRYAHLSPGHRRAAVDRLVSA